MILILLFFHCSTQHCVQENLGFACRLNSTLYCRDKNRERERQEELKKAAAAGTTVPKAKHRVVRAVFSLSLSDTAHRIRTVRKNKHPPSRNWQNWGRIFWMLVLYLHSEKLSPGRSRRKRNNEKRSERKWKNWKGSESPRKWHKMNWMILQRTHDWSRNWKRERLAENHLH